MSAQLQQLPQPETVVIEKKTDELDDPFAEEIFLYAYWSMEELHGLARELEIHNYQNIPRETLIELMIRRLF